MALILFLVRLFTKMKHSTTRPDQCFFFTKISPPFFWASHDRYQDQYFNLSTTLNWTFVSILRHNLQEPYLKVFLLHGFRLKELSIRSVCSRGLPFGSLLHSLRTITRFEDMIFLERREDVYACQLMFLLARF